MRRRPVELLLVAVAVLALACAGRTPEAAVEGFYQALDSGDVDKAMGLLSERTLSMVGPDKIKAGLQEASLDIKEKGGVSEVEITNEVTSGDASRITALIRYGNASTETQNFQLAKEGGSWKILPGEK
jgi:hypothetical protein